MFNAWALARLLKQTLVHADQVRVGDIVCSDSPFLVASIDYNSDPTTKYVILRDELDNGTVLLRDASVKIIWREALKASVNE
jgi:hypothetical protein